MLVLAVGRCCCWTLLPLGFVERGLLSVEEVNVAVEVDVVAVEVAVACCWTLLLLDVAAVGIR